MTKPGGKPTLSPDLPISDRMVLACLYRIAEAARVAGDKPGHIRAKKALAAAVVASKEALVP